MLKLNEAGWDRIVRILLGIALIFLGWGVFAGGLGLAFKLVGLVSLFTGLIGWCPLYALFHFGTKTA
jgi:hypothetical protein